MGNVRIAILNGQLGGTLQTSDGVSAMVLTGVTEAGGYVLGTPLLLTGLDDMAAQGITQANNPFAYRHVSDFYTEAGDGAQLYLMLNPASLKVHQLCDPTNADGAKKLLHFAQGRIKLLGILTNDDALGVAPVTTAGINEDMYAAIPKLGALAHQFFEAQKPFRAILGASSYTGNPAILRDVATGASNSRVSVFLGDTVGGTSAAIGLVLGRLSALPVMRKLSRVRTGAMTNATAFLGSQALERVAPHAPLIAEKGFITWCTYPNMLGYYLSSDATCTSPTEDYHAIARGRIVDKAHILAYTTFMQVVDDEVPINDDGTLDAGFCKWLSQQIINQLDNNMTVHNEISQAMCTIDPAQQLLSTNKLLVSLRLTPVGYATDIQVNLGFHSPVIGG